MSRLQHDACDDVTSDVTATASAAATENSRLRHAFMHDLLDF